MINPTLIFLNFLAYTSAYKFLVVFPIPGKSHSILGEGYVKHLLKAGHEVTYITPIPLKTPPTGLRQVDVSSNLHLIKMDEVMSLEKMMNKEVDITDSGMLFGMMVMIANNTLQQDSVQHLLHDTNEEFDAVITEWMFNELYSGFSAVFNCPLIWSSSMEPHYLVLSLIDENPNPSYTSDMITTEAPPFTFWQRTKKLWSFIATHTIKWLISGLENEIYDKAFRSAVAHRGRTLPPLSVVRYNGSLMLGNSHVSAGQAIRLPQNYKPIAGYHISDEVKSLPQDLQKLMDNAKHGVIYFSMGSMLKSKSLPAQLKQSFLDMFGGLKQVVIWKFEEKLDKLPKNVHIVHWAPQQSILAHPNCVVFITHGGLLSTTETLHFGVPIIGIPMYSDQFNNVNIAVAKGFAKRVDLTLNTPAALKTAIEDILENPGYSHKAKELSMIYHDRPASPGAELVHWVEHVVRTRGAPHLRSPALHVPWYQKAYLDLLIIILVMVIGIVVSVKKLIKFTYKSDLKKKRV